MRSYSLLATSFILYVVSLGSHTLTRWERHGRPSTRPSDLELHVIHLQSSQSLAELAQNGFPALEPSEKLLPAHSLPIA
jgi:hypothetical protein